MRPLITLSLVSAPQQTYRLDNLSKQLLLLLCPRRALAEEEAYALREPVERARVAEQNDVLRHSALERVLPSATDPVVQKPHQQAQQHLELKRE